MILLVSTIIILIPNKNNNVLAVDEVKLKNKVSKDNVFAMYVKKKDKYEPYNESDMFPDSSMYTLNLDESGCMDTNGNKVDDVLSSDGNNRVTVTSSQTVYCYLYFDLEKNAPTITKVSIKDDSEYTNTQTNKVEVSWLDNDVAYYCLKTSDIKPDTGDQCWQSVTGNKATNNAFDIGSGDGNKTVYAWLKDKAGNVSKNYGSDSITLDQTAPNLELTQNDSYTNQVVLKVNATDSSGIKSVTCNASSVSGASCSCTTDKTSCTFTKLQSGQTYNNTLKVTATDNANNSKELSGTYTTKIPIASESIIAKQPAGLQETNTGDLQYRFVGTNVNNYICIDSTGSNCGTNSNYLYRIIGITSDGKLKLIKANPYPNISRWDTAEIQQTWHSSTVSKNLNGDSFINVSAYIPTELKSKIIYMNWNQGLLTEDNANTGKEIYDVEISLQDFSSQIGLMYLSDYFFAENNEGTINCRASCTNWLTGSSGSGRQWTITREDADRFNPVSWAVDAAGFGIPLPTKVALTLYPVFYLSSDIKVTSGSGLSNDPFIIKI